MITRNIEANGLSHHVLEWRPTNAGGPVAVMLHGFQDGGASFATIAPSLAARGLHVFAPDLRGFGDTGRAPVGGYYHFPDYVMDLAELVDVLSPKKPIYLIGHSMGATVASMYAGTLPERVALLALLEGVGPPQMPDDLAPDRVRNWIEGVRRTKIRGEKPFTPEEAYRRLQQNHPNVPEAIIRARAIELSKPSGEPGLVVWKFDPLHRTQSPIGFSVGRWKAHAKRITAPTLVVSGGPAGYHPEDEADRVATIPNARTAEIAGAGHMMHWTKPAELTALLIEHYEGTR